MSDLIERDMAIDAIRNHIKDIDGDDDALDYIATNMLKDVPSARPREGKWMEAGRMTQFNQFYYFRYCSKCFYARDDCDSEKDTNFCPNCGADMREESHE